MVLMVLSHPYHDILHCHEGMREARATLSLPVSRQRTLLVTFDMSLVQHIWLKPMTYALAHSILESQSAYEHHFLA